MHSCTSTTEEQESHGRDNPFLWASQSRGSQHSWPSQKQLRKMDSAHFHTLAFFILFYFWFSGVLLSWRSRCQSAAICRCCQSFPRLPQLAVILVTRTENLSLSLHAHTYTHSHGLNWIWEGVATYAWLQHCYQHISGNSNPVSISLTLAILCIALSLCWCQQFVQLLQ